MLNQNLKSSALRLQTKVPNTNKDFLNPKALEQEYGISLTLQAKLRMRRYDKDPKSLPFIKLGKTILYKRADIEAWLDKNSVRGGFDEKEAS